MYRHRVLTTTAFILAAQMLILTPATAFERVGIDPSKIDVDVESRDVESTRDEDADGSVVIGGYLGAQPGCAGVQAFVEKRHADGSPAWALSAGAGKDCDLDGQPDGGGEPLFENMTSLDPDYILSSTVHEAIHAADGSVYFTGQLLVGWNGDGELTTAWGAYVLQKGTGGEHLADVYVGPQPTGSPVQLSDCVALCMALSETSLTQWGGRALAEVTAAEGPVPGLVLAGWEWSSGQGDDDKDVFFLHLDPGLQTGRWYNEVPFPGADLPVDVAVGDGGELYATGYYGPDRDVFVTRIDGLNGTLTHLFVAGGELDDWGQTVEVLATGEVEVRGTFTDEAIFGDRVLEGEGPTGFRAVLTPALELILAEVPGDGGGQSDGGSGDSLRRDRLGDAFAKDAVPPPEPNATEGNAPTRVDVLVGFAGTGTRPLLVGSSDDHYLVLYGETEPDHDKVEVVFEVPIAPGASILDSVELEFRSDHCTDLEVLLGGGDAGDEVYYALGKAPVCPYDEPTLAFGIPASVAAALGYSASTQSSAPLEAMLVMEVHGQTPSECSGEICKAKPGEDEKVDELAINSEYP